MRKMKKIVAGFLVMCMFIATFAQNAFANEGSKSMVGEGMQYDASGDESGDTGTDWDSIEATDLTLCDYTMQEWINPGEISLNGVELGKYYRYIVSDNTVWIVYTPEKSGDYRIGVSGPEENYYSCSLYMKDHASVDNYYRCDIWNSWGCNSNVVSLTKGETYIVAFEYETKSDVSSLIRLTRAYDLSVDYFECNGGKIKPGVSIYYDETKLQEEFLIKPVMSERAPEDYSCKWTMGDQQYTTKEIKITTADIINSNTDHIELCVSYEDESNWCNIGLEPKEVINYTAYVDGKAGTEVYFTGVEDESHTLSIMADYKGNKEAVLCEWYSYSPEPIEEGPELTVTNDKTDVYVAHMYVLDEKGSQALQQNVRFYIRNAGGNRNDAEVQVFWAEGDPITLDPSTEFDNIEVPEDAYWEIYQFPCGEKQFGSTLDLAYSEDIDWVDCSFYIENDYYYIKYYMIPSKGNFYFDEKAASLDTNRAFRVDDGTNHILEYRAEGVECIWYQRVGTNGDYEEISRDSTCKIDNIRARRDIRLNLFDNFGNFIESYDFVVDTFTELSLWGYTNDIPGCAFGVGTNRLAVMLNKDIEDADYTWYSIIDGEREIIGKTNGVIFDYDGKAEHAGVECLVNIDGTVYQCYFEENSSDTFDKNFTNKDFKLLVNDEPCRQYYGTVGEEIELSVIKDTGYFERAKWNSVGNFSNRDTVKYVISKGTSNVSVTIGGESYYLTIVGNEKKECVHKNLITYSVLPTCDKDGIIIERCQDCGFEKETVVKALGHRYVFSSHRSPTCDKDGIIIEHCQDCGFEKKTVVKALGHRYVFSGYRSPTCTTDGYISEVCLVCGQTHKTVLKATGHSYNKKVVHPTAKTKGYTINTCKNCGHEYCNAYCEPIATTKVTAVNSAKGIKLSWSKLANVDKYYVYLVSGTKETLIASTTATTYEYTKVTSGTTYTFLVVGGKGVYRGGKSAKVALKCVATPVVKTINETSGVKVYWSAVKGATAYYVYRVYGTAVGRIATVKTAYYVDKTAVAGKDYSYYVVAASGSVLSSKSTPVKIRRLKTPTVAVARASNGIKITSGTVIGAKYYNYYYRLGTGAWKLLKTTTSKYYVHTAAVKGKTYGYMVVASYGSYKSAGSAVKTIKR